MAIDISRESGYTLPTEISNEIIQKTQEASAVMQLARQITVPGRGLSIPVVTGDPTAEWVGETDEKPVSNSTLSTKILTPYKLAVIETFSKEFVRDAAALYNALVARLPRALASVFDATVFGASDDAPGSNFDTLGDLTGIDLISDLYAGLVTGDAEIADNGGQLNGFVFAPAGKALLLAETDTTGRPIFINNVSEGAVPVVLGAKTVISKGAYTAGTSSVAETVGFAGDWTQAIYGTVAGVEVSVSDTATLTSGSSTINLWQRNMVAVRAEIEVGFRADTDCFVRFTGNTAS